MALVLMGLRGSGKSTLGRSAAARLGVGFTDLDDVTPTLLGARDVRDAWDRFGEPAFRIAEHRALLAWLEHPAGVLALGGGTPTAPGAAELLRAARTRGVVRIIYLRGDAHTLAERLRGDANAKNQNRPAIHGADALAEIPQLLAARDPLYRELASDVIEIAGLSPEQVLARIAPSA